jgi:transposase InsO family protein
VSTRSSEVSSNAFSWDADDFSQELALLQRRPPVGLLHHTDWGGQYTSMAYQALLAAMNMSRRSNCWDNAIEIVECYYNCVWRSSLGYVSPVASEQKMG